MTAKIEFFYTHGHTYTATGVIDDTIASDGNIIRYSSTTSKENLDIRTFGVTEVQMADLKFAIVHFGEDSICAGSTSIIHGLVKKFDIMATFAEADKIRKLETQESQAELRTKLHKQKEAAKYVARRKKRSAERKEDCPAEEAELVKMAKKAQPAAK